MPDTGPCSHPVLFFCSCPEGGSPKWARALEATLHSMGRRKLWRQEGGARRGWELLGSFSRAGEMPPILGPLGKGEETAVYSSGCRKVMGEKAAIVCLKRAGAGSLFPRTLCSAQAPRPNLRKPCFLEGGGVRDWLSACLAVLRESRGGCGPPRGGSDLG